MRLVDQDAVVVEREDHPREHHVIDEDGVLVVLAVSFGALPTADAVRGLVFARRIGVPHVAAKLREIHAAVAVPLDHRRIVDLGIRRNQLESIARRKQEALCLFLGRPRLDRRLRGEVCAGVVLTSRSNAAAAPSSAGRLTLCRRQLRGGIRRRRLRRRGLSEQGQGRHRECGGTHEQCMSGRRSATILVQLRVPLCCRTAQCAARSHLTSRGRHSLHPRTVDGPHCGRGRSWPELGYYEAWAKYGGRREDRTPDLRVANAALSQLS